MSGDIKELYIKNNLMKYRIGIVGFGFVGESQAFAFAPTADIKVYDIDETKRTHSLEETLLQEFVFVCLPTPMKKNGSQDLSIIENFFANVPGRYNPTFILKSTVLPGTTKMLESKYNLKIVFCPEFLTEKTAKLDMLTQARIVIGGNPPLCQMVVDLFKSRFGNKHYVITDPTSAELVKYMANNFLTVIISPLFIAKPVEIETIKSSLEVGLLTLEVDLLAEIGDFCLLIPNKIVFLV
jgi:UDPglucose 6-dehydrogenase